MIISALRLDLASDALKTAWREPKPVKRKVDREKSGPVGPVLATKPGPLLAAKSGPPGPVLSAKSGPTLPKVDRVNS